MCRHGKGLRLRAYAFGPWTAADDGRLRSGRAHGQDRYGCMPTNARGEARLGVAHSLVARFSAHDHEIAAARLRPSQDSFERTIVGGGRVLDHDTGCSQPIAKLLEPQRLAVLQRGVVRFALEVRRTDT